MVDGSLLHEKKSINYALYIITELFMSELGVEYSNTKSTSGKIEYYYEDAKSLDSNEIWRDVERLMTISPNLDLYRDLIYEIGDESIEFSFYYLDVL